MNLNDILKVSKAFTVIIESICILIFIGAVFAVIPFFITGSWFFWTWHWFWAGLYVISVLGFTAGNVEEILVKRYGTEEEIKEYHRQMAKDFGDSDDD